MTMQGIVKFFNSTKGFGYITPTDGGKDIFFRKSEELSSPQKGDTVEFEVYQGEKGPYATNVRVLN